MTRYIDSSEPIRGSSTENFVIIHLILFSKKQISFRIPKTIVLHQANGHQDETLLI